MSRSLESAEIRNEWAEIEHIFRSGLPQHRNADGRSGIDWDAIEQDFLGGALCVGCRMLERAGKKPPNGTPRDSELHSYLLFALRNAYVHNGSNVADNNDKAGFPAAKKYLADGSRNELEDYFEMDSVGVMRLKKKVLWRIRQELERA